MATDKDAALDGPRREDPKWQERIERAKIAREEGRKAREGKPALLGMRRHSLA